MKRVPQWRTVLACLTWLACSAVGAAKDRPAIWDLFRPPQFSQVDLSPDGTRLSFLFRRSNAVDVAVLRVDGEGQKLHRIPAPRASFSWVRWAGNETLLFGVADPLMGDSGGVFAMNPDGSNARMLTPSVVKQIGKAVKVSVSEILSHRPDAEGRILMLTDSKRGPDVVRVDLKTGKREKLWSNPGNVASVLTDKAGNVRVMVRYDRDRIVVLHQPPGRREPEVLREMRLGDPFFTPVWLSPDGESLHVTIDANGGEALHVMKLSTRELGPALFTAPGYELGSGWPEEGTGELAGIGYTDDRPRQHFFKPPWERTVQLVNSSLPSRINWLTTDSEDGRRVVIHSSGDRHPGEYFLCDTQKPELRSLFLTAPWLEGVEFGEMRPIEYRARDGLLIHGYLTLPPGSSGKNLPLIVLPHGGPWMRDVWGWNPEVQFFATRGYAVLQPNYRGSTGYGFKFLEAGFKEWGAKMQDDVADAAKWAIAEGIADPGRIAIYGASYGGYAAMMGLIQTPDLFRCGISYCGVMNLRSQARTGHGLHPFVLHFRDAALGAAWEDSAELRSRSPVNLVDQIKAPVLFAYGGLDSRVEAEQGRKFVEALKRRRKEVQVIYKASEGHGFDQRPNLEEFYGAVEKFLEKHLGKP